MISLFGRSGLDKNTHPSTGVLVQRSQVGTYMYKFSLYICTRIHGLQCVCFCLMCKMKREREGARQWRREIKGRRWMSVNTRFASHLLFSPSREERNIFFIFPWTFSAVYPPVFMCIYAKVFTPYSEHDGLGIKHQGTSQIWSIYLTLLVKVLLKYISRLVMFVSLRIIPYSTYVILMAENNFNLK